MIFGLAYKTRLSASFFALVLLLVSGCAEKQPQTSFAGATMGTTYHIKIVDGVAEPDKLHARIDTLLQAVNQSMSTYIEDSEINRFNRAQPGEPFAVSAGFCKVLSLSKQVFEMTGGAFDPTVRPLVDLWGFGPENHPDRIPAQQQITDILGRIGFQHVRMNCEELFAEKDKAVTLDLSAIAKGFGVDEVASLLAGEGYTNYMVEIGGEVKLAGHNSQGDKWHIAVEKPDALSRTVQKVLVLSDTGMATSGDYRNYFEKDGVRYSHTIDPKTGEPIRHNLASVTVIHPDTAMADGLATAFMVMGYEKANKVAEKLEISAYFLVRENMDYSEHATSGFDRLLKEAY